MADRTHPWPRMRTKGPWHQSSEPDNLIVCDPEGGSIADCAPPGPWMSFDTAIANAAAIVRWENSFDELVAALGDLLDCGAAILGASTYDDDAREAFDMYDAARKHARAALAKAKVRP